MIKDYSQAHSRALNGQRLSSLQTNSQAELLHPEPAPIQQEQVSSHPQAQTDTFRAGPAISTFTRLRSELVEIVKRTQTLAAGQGCRYALSAHCLRHNSFEAIYPSKLLCLLCFLGPSFCRPVSADCHVGCTHSFQFIRHPWHSSCGIRTRKVPVSLDRPNNDVGCRRWPNAA